MPIVLWKVMCFRNGRLWDIEDCCPGSTIEKRNEIMQEWYRLQLYTFLPSVINKMGREIRGKGKSVLPSKDEKKMERISYLHTM